MRFRIDQDSYIDDKPVRAGQEIDVAKRAVRILDGKGGFKKIMSYPTPGPHWFPVDDEAKALMAEMKVEHTGEVPDVIEQLKVDLQARLDLDYDKFAAALAAVLPKAATSPALDIEALAVAIAKAQAPVPALDVAGLGEAIGAALAKALAAKPAG